MATLEEIPLTRDLSIQTDNRVEFARDKLPFQQTMNMPEPKNLQPLWDQPVGEDLSGIVFVRDYLQLQVNPPPQINVYSSHVAVSSDRCSAVFGEEPFANRAIGLIGHFVREVRVDLDQSFRIILTGGAEIIISLRPQHYRGPEVLDFHGRNNQWAAI